jgi:hypothetical protein
MKQSLFPLAIAILATCPSVDADGLVLPGGRFIPNRLPIPRLIGMVQEGQPAPAAPSAPAAPPAVMDSSSGLMYHDYPFSNRCGCDTSGCDGLWGGYTRKCCGHGHLGWLHHGWGGGGCCNSCASCGCNANTFSGGAAGPSPAAARIAREVPSTPLPLCRNQRRR